MSPRPLVGSAFALAAGTLWSFGVLTVRFADTADPWQYLIWRSLGVIVITEAIALAMGHSLLLPRFLRTDRLGFVAACGLALAAIAFIYALKTTTVANAVFFSSTAPLQTAVMARLLLGERLGPSGVAAVAVGLLGLAIMAGGDFGAGNLAGNLSALLSAFGFAIYAVSIRLAPDRDWSPTLAGYGLITLVLCLAATLANGKPVLIPSRDTAMAVLHGAVLIGFGTLFFNRASRTMPAVGLTVLAQAETVFAPLWIYLIFAEVPRMTSLVGGGLILTAIVIKAVGAVNAPEARPAASA